MTDYKLVPVELLKDWHERINTIAAEMAFNVADEMESMLATAPAVQGEPVGWQFYQHGKWWYGDDHIKDHKKNTQEAGFRVRDVYAAPQQAPDVSALVEALELISDTDPDEGTAWFHEIAYKALAAHRKGGDA